MANKCLRTLTALSVLLTCTNCALSRSNSTQSDQAEWAAICSKIFQVEASVKEQWQRLASEEYEVYEAVLEAEFVSDQTEQLIVLEEPVTDGVDWLLERVVGVSEELTVTEAMLIDFQSKHQAAYLIENRFDLTVPVVLVSRENICSLTSGPGGWDKFRAYYPQTGGWKEFSRVGFDVARQAAFVYVGHTVDSLVGMGKFYLLAKDGTEWVVEDYVIVWIS